MTEHRRIGEPGPEWAPTLARSAEVREAVERALATGAVDTFRSGEHLPSLRREAVRMLQGVAAGRQLATGTEAAAWSPVWTEVEAVAWLILRLAEDPRKTRSPTRWRV